MKYEETFEKLLGMSIEAAEKFAKTDEEQSFHYGRAYAYYTALEIARGKDIVEIQVPYCGYTNKVFKTHEDLYDYLWDAERCHNCRRELEDDAWITHSESRGEHFGTPCSEEVIDGYVCTYCSHREEV